MQVLKKLFLDENLNLFTSNFDLHKLNQVRLFKTSGPSEAWVINHNLTCPNSIILTQIFSLSETHEAQYRVVIPDSIKHSPDGSSTVTFAAPVEGYALMTCDLS